jgi:acyl-CoA thioester hydrolase
MPESFTHSIRVRYGDCDLQGVVFNANWLAYFDVVITELWRARVGGYSQMVEQGADMVVAEARLRLLGPARFDDVVELELRVARLGRTSLSTHIAASVDGRPVAEGEMRHVFVEPGTTTTTREMPAAVRTALEPLLADDA